MMLSVVRVYVAEIFMRFTRNERQTGKECRIILKVFSIILLLLRPILWQSSIFLILFWCPLSVWGAFSERDISVTGFLRQVGFFPRLST